MKPEDIGDLHFAAFAAALERLLAKKKLPARGARHEHQKKQMESLVATEIAFRQALIARQLGPVVYRGFIKHIREERRNILAARPFFRERNTVFRDRISGALASNVPENLYPFGINAVFIQFVLERFTTQFRAGSPVLKLAAKALAIREEIVVENLPLAINRAKIFRAKTPSSPHMGNMDLQQVSIEGLLSAVDKFVLPYSPRFCAVIIGRSTGNLISNYSEPLLHFFPGDRRKIYQANKARRRFSDIDKITQYVNDSLPMELKTNSDEIQLLLNASSHLSLDQPLPSHDSQETSTFSDYTLDNQALPDEIVERKDLIPLDFPALPPHRCFIIAKK